MPIDQKQRARKAWPILVKQVTKVGDPLTYRELTDQMGLHWRAAQFFLGVIQSYCKKNKLPALQAMVVGKTSRLPGGGYIGSARTRQSHDAELKKVLNHGWPKKAPF